MANKKVKLQRPSGTDSEGNIKVAGGPVVLDLGDFDDIFGPLESDTRSESPLEQFWSGMKDSFTSRMNTKDVVRNFLRSAAPDGISNLMGFADEALSASRDIKESLERTNASDLQYIAKRAQALLPQLKEHAPEGIYNSISQGLEDKIDEYDYTIQSQRDQTPIRRAREDQQNENAITSALDNIALTERLNHNRSEQAAQYRHDQNRAEESIRDVLKTKRFDWMSKAMGMTADGIQRIAGYTEQINYGFQRKGLELQFRSYLGIKELVKLNEANLELQARAYNAMIRNTGLTDYQKSQAKGLDQMPQQGQKPGLMRSAGTAMAQKTLSNFLGNYSNEMQGKFTSDISRKLALGVMAMRMGEGGPSLWDNKWRMAGGLAGDYAGDFLLNDLIPMLGREARPGLTKVSDTHFGGRHNQIGYYLDNMPAFLQEFVNNGQNQHGWKGKIRDMIAPYVPQFGLQDRTTSGNFQTIDQPAQFNQMTQRTITDAIPGYLARLLQEVRMIRTGRDDVAREVFDITTGTFRAEKTAHDALINKIVPKTAVRSASATINDALNTMDSGGQLSPRARQALSERMLRDASTNRRFDPDAYIKARGYADDVPPEVAAELDQFFRGKFEFDDKGSMVDSADNHRLRQEFSQAFLDIRSISRDPIKEIQRMINTGHTEPLRAVGIIITQDGQDKINYPRIWEILRGGVTDVNPWAPGGSGYDPNRPDNSGTVGHKDFMGPDFPGHEAAWAKNKMTRFRSRFAPEEQIARDKMAKHLKAMRGRFGSAAESVKEGYEKVGEHAMSFTADPKAYAAMAKADWTSKFNTMTEKVSNADIDAMRGKTAGYVPQGMQAITDLYSSFDPTNPIIKGIDFAAGNLIDLRTKQIITKPEDITGEVINRQGMTVVTEAEAASGLLNPQGNIVVKAVDSAQQAVSKALGLHQNRNASSGAAGTTEDADPNSEENLNSQDWALGPGEDPVITARGMSWGEYLDDMGKQIRSIKDIKGDVFDKAGNLVLSAKEFANGLWSKRTGARYRPTKNFARLLRFGKFVGTHAGKTTGQMAWSATKFAAKVAVGTGARVFNFMVDNQNAYLPDDRNPVLTRRALQNGEYFDDKGKVVEDFLDVYSPLRTATGELVIPAEQYRDLRNWDGTKHILAKNRRIWARFVMRPLRAVRDWYVKKSKQYYGWLGRKSTQFGGWLGKKTLGGLARVGGNVFNRMFERIEDPNVQAQVEATMTASQQQTSVLAEILQTLKDQKPKELRKGSWQEQALRKDKDGNLIDKNGNKVEDDRQESLLKRGLKGIAGMLGFGKGDGEEDDEGFGLSDAADIADIADAGGDALDRRRRRREGGPGGKKRGWLGRKWDKLANSKAGKVTGNLVDKAAKSRMGQWAMNSTVGKWIAGAGASIASRAALMAGTGIAGLLSAPVVAGAAVVGGTYLAAKRYSEINGEFRDLRFEQYGVGEPVDQGLIDGVWNMSLFSLGGDKKKVQALEDLLMKHTDRESDNPAFRVSAAGGVEILDVMGIDIDDEAAVMVFARWLEKRFKPVYLAWVAGLFKVGKPDAHINEVDYKLPRELKADFLETIKFPYKGDTPYNSLDNPFSADYPLVPNADKIEEMFNELTEKYGKDRKKPEAKTETKADIKKAATATAAAGGTAAAYNEVVKKGSSIENLAKTYADADAKSKVGLFTGATVASGAGLSGAVTLANQKVGNTLTALQSIRMRAYGLQTLNLAEVKSILALEAEYAKDLNATPYSVDYNGDTNAFFTKAGELLGMDSTVGSADAPKLYNWINDRFAPAFRAYYGAAKNAQPAANLANIESKLPGSDKVLAASAIMGAINGDGKPIWGRPTIFEVKGPLEDLKALADADLEHLKKEAEKEVAASPTQKSSDQVAGKSNAESGGSFADKALAAVKNTWDSAKQTVSTTWNNAKDSVTDGYAAAKIAVGMGPDYGGDGKAAGGVIQSGGVGGTVLQGNGGQWEQIPMPASSGSARAALPTLAAVSKMTGVPRDWLMAIAGIESGFRYDIKSPTSSATGWYQFIDGTWDAIYKKYGDKFGCPPDVGKTRLPRKDPRINALMGAMFMKDNYDALVKGLGRTNLTDTDIYMAHFLGVGGALKFFRADPNAMAYKVFQKEYSANMPLFFVNSRPSQPRTISELYKLFQAKLEKFWQTSGKGLRENESQQGSEQPQTPGAEAPPKSDEELAKEKLAADAKDKSGVAAQAEDGTPAGPGAENAKTEAASKPTVASLAAGATPMPGAPSTSSTGSGSTTTVATDSGGQKIDDQREQQLNQAQAQNQRRESEVRRDQQIAKTADEYQRQMLQLTTQIRDHLAIIAEQASIDSDQKRLDDRRASREGQGNNMTTQTIQQRPASQRPSQVTLR